MRVRPTGRTLEARLATGKKNPHRKMGVLFFARPPYFLAGAAVTVLAKSSVMLK